MYCGRNDAQLLPNCSAMYFSTATWPALSFTASCVLRAPLFGSQSVSQSCHAEAERVAMAMHYPLDVRRLLRRLVDAGAADEQELPHAGRLRPVRHRPAPAQSVSQSPSFLRT